MHAIKPALPSIPLTTPLDPRLSDYTIKGPSERTETDWGQKQPSNLISKSQSTQSSTEFLWRQRKTIRLVSFCETHKDESRKEGLSRKSCKLKGVIASRWVGLSVGAGWSQFWSWTKLIMECSGEGLWNLPRRKRIQASELWEKLQVGICILLDIIGSHRKQPQVALGSAELILIPFSRKILAENTAWIFDWKVVKVERVNKIIKCHSLTSITAGMKILVL